MSFWDIIWFIIITFAFVAYLMVMFNIIIDLFRDKDESGVMKAVWIILLIFFPLITALVYLIVRGEGMARRQTAMVQQAQDAQEAYVRQVAGSGSSPADQIAKAKQLHESGAITDAEYEALKAKALA